MKVFLIRVYQHLTSGEKLFCLVNGEVMITTRHMEFKFVPVSELVKANKGSEKDLALLKETIASKTGESLDAYLDSEFKRMGFAYYTSLTEEEFNKARG